MLPDGPTLGKAWPNEVYECDREEIDWPDPNDSPSEELPQIDTATVAVLFVQKATCDHIATDYKEEIDPGEAPVHQVDKARKPVAQKHRDNGDSA